MSRDLNAILQELDTLVVSLSKLDYVRESSDLRNVCDILKSGSETERRFRKSIVEESSSQK